MLQVNQEILISNQYIVDAFMEFLRKVSVNFISFGACVIDILVLVTWKLFKI